MAVQETFALGPLEGDGNHRYFSWTPIFFFFWMTNNQPVEKIEKHSIMSHLHTLKAVLLDNLLCKSNQKYTPYIYCGYLWLCYGKQSYCLLFFLLFHTKLHLAILQFPTVLLYGTCPAIWSTSVCYSFIHAWKPSLWKWNLLLLAIHSLRSISCGNETSCLNSKSVTRTRVYSGSRYSFFSSEAGFLPFGLAFDFLQERQKVG